MQPRNQIFPTVPQNVRKGERLQAATVNQLIEAIGHRRLSIGGMTFRQVSSAVFSGVAYVAGNQTKGLTADPSKPYVKCVFSTGAATEETGPPAIPFPDDEEWYEKNQTSGDIHDTRS